MRAILLWDARVIAESAHIPFDPHPGDEIRFQHDVDFTLDKEILDLWGDGRIFAESTLLRVRFIHDQAQRTITHESH